MKAVVMRRWRQLATVAAEADIELTGAAPDANCGGAEVIQ
jgi:hypothetical protein